MEGWHQVLFMDALDDKLGARVSDYGLSSLVANEKRGLVGYVDDEFWSNGGGEACKESDVYGFGVVLLELLTGRRTEEGLLVRWALPFIKEMRLSELLDQIRLEGCLTWIGRTQILQVGLRQVEWETVEAVRWAGDVEYRAVRWAGDVEYRARRGANEEEEEASLYWTMG
ncbi:hypothetical protein NC652_010570 [Populus alba x Populus x berolinensis]|nr:hypothetical protein NC652_010570 [Populus alba x Populus x berolinensis]